MSRKGEDAAPNTDHHKFMHEPDRLVVPMDEKDREKALKDNQKLKDLVAG